MKRSPGGGRCPALWAVGALFCTCALEGGKVGALTWDEVLSASGEYNSNITTSETDPVADLVLQARFEIRGSWEMTRDLILSYGFGVGYRRYVGDSDFGIDRAAVRLVPDTSFDFDVRLSDQLTFNVSDTIEFSENASDIAIYNESTGELETNIFSFERIQNTASVNGNWSVNRRNQMSGNLWRGDTIPLSSRFDDFRRTQHGVSGTWTKSLNPSLRAGLTGSLYSTRYETDLNNDSEGASWGPFFEYGLTSNMTLKGNLTFVRTHFDRGDQRAGVEDHFDYRDVEWSLAFEHAFNAKMSYVLDYRHTSDYGYLSNYRMLRVANATFSWQATRTGQAYLSTSYEWGRDSGGVAPDDWERFFISVGYKQPIWRDFEITARIRWTDKASRVKNRSYEQFTFYLGLVYFFPQN